MDGSPRGTTNKSHTSSAGIMIRMRRRIIVITITTIGAVAASFDNVVVFSLGPLHKQ